MVTSNLPADQKSPFKVGHSLPFSRHFRFHQPQPSLFVNQDREVDNRYQSPVRLPGEGDRYKSSASVFPNGKWLQVDLGSAKRMSALPTFPQEIWTKGWVSSYEKGAVSSRFQQTSPRERPKQLFLFYGETLVFLHFILGLPVLQEHFLQTGQLLRDPQCELLAKESR